VHTFRPVVIAVSSVLAALVLIVAGVLVPTVLFRSSERQSEKAEREARALIARRIDTYAAQVLSHSKGPDGPPPAELAEFGDQASLFYATERSGDALTALWVIARAQTGGMLGPYVIYECYTIGLHDLGTVAAGSQVKHLQDCDAVNARIKAQMPTPSPTVSSGR
jgi:hypothetical protein